MDVGSRVSCIDCVLQINFDAITLRVGGKGGEGGLTQF